MATPVRPVFESPVQKKLFVRDSPVRTPGRTPGRTPRPLPETPIKGTAKHRHVTVRNYMDFIPPGRNIANDPSVVCIGSPRSLKSCAQCGVDPSELYPVPFDVFERREIPLPSHNALGGRVDIRPNPLERRRIARQRFEAFETQRKQKIQLVRTQREVLIAEETVKELRLSGGESSRQSHAGESERRTAEPRRSPKKSEFLMRKTAAEIHRRTTLERAKAITKASEVAILKAQIAREQRRADLIRAQRIEEQLRRERIEQKRTERRVSVEQNVRQQVYHQRSLQQKCDVTNHVCHTPRFGKSLRELDKLAPKTKAQQQILVHDAKLAYLTPRDRSAKIASSRTEKLVN